MTRVIHGARSTGSSNVRQQRRGGSILCRADVTGIRPNVGVFGNNGGRMAYCLRRLVMN